MKQLSVIIPCYNVEQYIDQCVGSIVNQTCGIERLQLILVDDCSTDDTLGKLLKWEQRYPDDIVLVSLENNIKQGGARNVGLQYVSGKYISFIDSDDWIELDMYEKMLQKIEEYQCDVVGCGMYRNSQDGRMQVFTSNEEDAYYEQEKSVVEGGADLPDLPGGIVCRIYNAGFIQDSHVSFPEGLKYEDNYWGNITDLYRHSEYLMKECFYHYRENSLSTTLSRNDDSHFDRLTIEVMKLQKYKELGIYEKNKTQYDYYFMFLYYYNTWYLMVSRFDEPPYEQFCRMQKEVLQYVPDYMENEKLKNETNDLYKELIRLIPLNLSKEEFAYIYNTYKENLGQIQNEWGDHR